MANLFLSLRGEGSFCKSGCFSEAGFLIPEESSFSCSSVVGSGDSGKLVSVLILPGSSKSTADIPSHISLCLLSFPKLAGVYIWGPSVILASHDNCTGACFFSLPHVDVSYLDLFSNLTLVCNLLMLFYPWSCRYFYLDVTSNPLLSIKVSVEGFLLVKQDYEHRKVAT